MIIWCVFGRLLHHVCLTSQTVCRLLRTCQSFVPYILLAIFWRADKTRGWQPGGVSVVYAMPVVPGKNFRRFQRISSHPKAQTKKRHAQRYVPPYVICYMSKDVSVYKLSGLGRYTKTIRFGSSRGAQRRYDALNTMPSSVCLQTSFILGHIVPGR